MPSSPLGVYKPLIVIIISIYLSGQIDITVTQQQLNDFDVASIARQHQGCPAVLVIIIMPKLVFMPQCFEENNTPFLIY